MAPSKEQQPLNVVDITSSDDEDSAVAGKAKASSRRAPTHSQTRPEAPQGPQSQRQSSKAITPPVANNKSLDSRSFWKAGAYDVGSKAKPQFGQGELEHARVHPKFLHSNATSHKWAFGAIAELLDNAVDEIYSGATFVIVDKVDIVKDNSPALLFQDDGGGMDPDGIRKCMSLGYSSKKANKTIGQYGNGFKTSTMRLGADAIVFSRTTRAGHATQSIGLLSYTFLRTTGQDDVIVPMIDFDISGHWAEPIIYSSHDDWTSNLKTILEWSPFTSKGDLMLQFEDIGSHGTKVIIFNLWLNEEGIYELSFDDDDEDIRLRDEANRGGLTKLHKKQVELQSHISYRIRFSLRAYVSILYLRKLTNFNIILRGKPVEQYNVADDLKYLKVVMYRPQLPMASKEVTVETTIGFIKEAPNLSVSGFNVYNKNRLIMPFWKVTGDGSTKGNGVVGVLEANFMEPAHDKQDFERSSVFIRLENRLKQMATDYWKAHCHLIGLQPLGFSAAKLHKHQNVQPSVRISANMRKQLAAEQNEACLSDNSEEQMHIYQPIVGLSANMRQDLSNWQPENNVSTSNSQNDLTYLQQSPGLLAGSNEEPIFVDGPDSQSLSVDQICEENIKLFLRCEEHMHKETKLKQMIQELEKKLKEAKMRRDQLISYVDTRKKQKIMEEQAQKVG